MKNNKILLTIILLTGISVYAMENSRLPEGWLTVEEAKKMQLDRTTSTTTFILDAHALMQEKNIDLPKFMAQVPPFNQYAYFDVMNVYRKFISKKDMKKIHQNGLNPTQFALFFIDNDRRIEVCNTKWGNITSQNF